MTELTTKSELQEGNSSSLVWNLKNWKNLHKILALQADCILQVGNVKLRFFLKILTEVSKNYQDQRDTIIEQYSLCVQLLSYHKNAFFKVVTKYNRLVAGVKREIEKESQVYLEKSTADYLGTEVVDPGFYKLGIWNKSYEYSEKYLTESWRKNYSETLEDLDIKIAVTLLKFIQEGDHQSIEASKIKTGNTFLPRVQKFLQTTKENPFAETISLSMKDDVVLLAHRLILSGASPVFEAMLTSDFLEAKSKTVHIQDITSEVMKVILWYMYTGEIDPSCDKLMDQVIYAASKYQFDGSLEHCDNSLIDIGTTENIFTMMKLANKYNLGNALEKLTKYVETNSLEIVMSQLSDSKLDSESTSNCEVQSVRAPKSETQEHQAVYLHNPYTSYPNIFP